MLRQRIANFMRGRYGMDRLNIFLLALGIIINLIFSFTGYFGLSYRVMYQREAVFLLLLLRAVGYIPYIAALFRALSRNREKRLREEAAFMGVAGNWIAYFSKKAKQKKDTDHRYFDCPGCHRTLRVPRNRGKIKISCPHCGREFKKRT